MFATPETCTNKLTFTFVNLILANSKVALQSFQTNIEFIINECIFRNNSVGIRINQTAHFTLLPLTVYQAKITNSSFYSSPIQQIEKKYSRTGKYELLINNCSFLSDKAKKFYQNGIFVNSFAENTNITITKTIFKNHFGLSYKEHLLWIKDKYFNKIRETTFIKLDQLTFESNFLKKTLIYVEAPRSEEFMVVLENSLFRNNSGIIEFAISPFQEKENIFNRDGLNNTILLRNNTFLSNCYFPSQGSAGLYATLFFNYGWFEIMSCRFIDNRHGKGPSTGVISISDTANVSFESCYFEIGKDHHDTAVQVFAYPNSLLKFFGNNTFNILKLDDSGTIFVHLPSNNLPRFTPGEHGRVQLAGVLKFICPQGFQVDQQTVINPNQVKNETISYTYLHTMCSPCPRKTYSLERGTIINIPNDTTPALNISGGTTKYKNPDFKCYECPRGGRCHLGYLSATANFWGYKIGKEVRFIDCPHDYCCDKHRCPTYDGCHGRRTGALCGRCPDGASESLFSTACRRNKACNPSVFFPAATFLIIVYILFFLYNEDIVCFLHKGFSVKMPSLSDRSDAANGSGCIKIIFYYYQTINLLTSSVGFEEKQKIIQRVNDLISDVFNLVVADISSFDCPLPSITPVWKTLMSHSLGLVLFFTLGVSCLIWKLSTWVRGRTNIRANNGVSSLNPLVENAWEIGNLSVNNYRRDFYEENERNTDEDVLPTSFSQRALGAFTHISLLTYSATTTLCLTLLHCVPYKDTKVLFIDGTMQCYQLFQHALLGYVIISVLPFCMVPFLGSYVLNLGSISVTQFCLGCLLPFPFCCYWLRLLLRHHSNVQGYHRHDLNELNKNRVAILHILSGPFRTHEAIACFPRSRLAWEGVLILRRLVLILILAFIYDGRWRALSALLACVLILVIHLRVQPFRKRWENCLETASLATLVIFCGFTLVKSLYRGEDYSSLYTNSTFMQSINMTESVLIIFPLAVIVLVAFVLLFSRLIFFCVQHFRAS